jgi:ABC-type sugar transport system ATPase subunit
VTEAAPALALEAVTKRYGDVDALKPLTLTVQDGEFMVLVGPSGCGKTTALRLIAGLDTPSSGEISIGGASVLDVDPADRDIAMVFQNYALYPHMTVGDNLSFGLRMRKTPKDDVARRVMHAAKVLALEGLLTRRPAELSGGQRQRVALGRAIVREPRVFLFDEPLSNLDAQLRAEMRDEIAGLHTRLRTAIVYVTHDQIEAMTLGQRIAIMRDGVLQQCDQPVQVYRNPANLFVARFIGTPTINTIDGAVRDGAFVADSFSARVSCSHHGPATLGVRPEAIGIELTEGPNARFSVRRTEFVGSESLVHLAGPNDVAWVARVSPERSWATGDRVQVQIDPTRILLFDSDGRRLAVDS